VAGDDARLGQVFVNLLTNAAHAMPEDRQSDNVIVVSSEVDDAGYAVVRIRDNGVGIDPTVVDRIFDPFFTTKPTTSSSGLGLAICHSIVTTMGGELLVESTPGVGTALCVRLPPAPNTRSLRPMTIQTSAMHRARILIIDDEPMIVDALKRILSESHSVCGATSAAAALEILHADPEFDLIFCDLMMPGMTGMELYDRLLDVLPEVVERIVFMTGGAFAPRAADFLQRIPNPCLDKPVRAREIEAFIQSFMEKRTAPPPTTTIGM
jgi:CheY-like chemotaxis protein/anti-sigma regulatory factor (Ser/Thr protein kinase)